MSLRRTANEADLFSERRATGCTGHHQGQRPAGGAVEVACLSHFCREVRQTNVEYIILGSKVVKVDAELGIVLEEFDFPA